MSHFRLAVMLVLISITAAALAQTPAPFEQYVNYPLSQAQSVAIGDLNGDGKDDVAAACWPSGLYVFYQAPDGTLISPPTSLYSPSYPYGLAVGDLNNDLRPDLVVADVDSMVNIYYQQQDGTLGTPQSYYVGGWATSIALADVNADGLVDIATTSSTDINTSVVIIRQDPAGGFGWPDRRRLTGMNSRCVSPLDLNHDGKADLAFLVDGSVGYILQNALGDLDLPQYLPASWGYSLTTGDVTGDGLDDIVYTTALAMPDAAIGVYAQASAGGLAPLVKYPTYHTPQPLTLLDIDSDGKLDVAAAHGNFGEVSLNFQLPDSTLSFWGTLIAPDMNNYQYNALAAGDLNGDGVKDLALVDQFNGLNVFLHQSAPRDTTPPTCTVEVTGTQGLNGWYTSAVGVTLNAVDNEGGSGVKAAYYTLNGQQWNEYSGSISVANEGATRIGYFAEDQTGNRSQEQWLDLNLDTQAPVITLAPAETVLWPARGQTEYVQFTITASDLTSGVSYLHLKVVDEYGQVQPEMDVSPGVVTVPLVAYRDPADADGRSYTIVLTGKDAAGNISTAYSLVRVPAKKNDKGIGPNVKH